MIFRVWVYRQRHSPVQQLLLYLSGLHIIHPCSAQDAESQNAVWLNYYQLSRFERVRPLCRQFVHWAARRVLCKTMFEVSLSAGDEKHSHHKTDLLSNTMGSASMYFFAVSFIWTLWILKKSNWIVLEFPWGVASPFLGLCKEILDTLPRKKLDNLAKKQQKKEENQPLNSLTNETTNTVIIGGRALGGVRSYIWTITASFIWGAVHMNRFHTLLCMFNDFM